jgi:spoIIIJ-associated protein
MINQEEIEFTRDLIRDFFNQADFFVDVYIKVISKEDRDILEANIKTDEAQNLIGKQGLVLADIQLLLRKVIKKKINRDFYINIDIDNYKKNKEDYLRDFAQNIADEVSKTKEQKEIPLPSAFDRRIVHIELEKRKDVLTESIGQGEERKIIIKPAI